LTVSQSITFGHSTTVSGKLAAASPMPTGELVSIVIGSASVTVPIQAGGLFSATIDTRVLGASNTPYSIIYSFAGDANFRSTNDNSTTVTVNKATPVLTVSAPGGAFTGAPLPAAVTIVSGIPGIDDTPAPRLENVTPTLTYFEGAGTSGTSRGSTPPINPGVYTVVAHFPGSADFAAVDSAPMSFMINRAATQVVLMPQAVFRHRKLVSIGLKAEIHPVAAGGGTPTGVVQFEFLMKLRKKTKMNLLGRAALNHGQAMLTLKPKQVLNKTITVIYGGDPDYLATSLAPFKLTTSALKPLARPASAGR
jgi:hypothetical protein